MLPNANETLTGCAAAAIELAVAAADAVDAAAAEAADGLFELMGNHSLFKKSCARKNVSPFSVSVFNITKPQRLCIFMEMYYRIW